MKCDARAHLQQTVSTSMTVYELRRRKVVVSVALVSVVRPKPDKQVFGSLRIYM